MKALLSPFGAGVSGLVALATLTIASSQGQHESIAGYSLGVTVAAFCGVLVGAGSTFAYSTGSDITRRAVRQLRGRVVAPVCFIALTAATTWAVFASPLPGIAVLAGGLGAMANNAAEIEASHLRRTLQIPRNTVIDVTSRTFALIIVVLGGDFANAFAVGALLRLGLLWYAARGDTSRRLPAVPWATMLSESLAPSLVMTSLAYIVMDRSALLLASVALNATLAGQFAVVVGVQQGLSAICAAGLHVALAQRGTGSRARWLAHLEGLLIAAAVLLAAVLMSFPHWFLHTLGLQGFGGQAWTTIALLLPIAVLGRALAFRLIASGQRRLAGASLVGAASVSALGGTILVLTSAVSLNTLAILMVATELTALTALTVCAAFARRTETPQR